MTAQVRTYDGVLPSGIRYLLKVPEPWDGTLILWSYGPPREPADPAWNDREPIIDALLKRGHAIAGCSSIRFWPIEEMVPDQLRVLELFGDTVGRPARTIAMGRSIGGLLTASLVQMAADRLSGALVLCGTVGGGIGTHEQQLDCTFTFRTLCAPETELQVARIRDPQQNVRIALDALERAQATAEGRARLALAGVLGGVASWFDPVEPRPSDPLARQRDQYRWFKAVDWHVFLEVRAVVEERGGGNPSSNVGVDYADLLARSAESDLVHELYGLAGLDVAADLDALAREPRIDADEQAVEYYERYIAFDGRLRGVPVVTLHSLGDGLVPADHLRSYGDVVAWAGDSDLLRQLYIERGGHCAFTVGEMVLALDGLLERVGSGAWPDMTAGALNQALAQRPADVSVLPRMFSADIPGGSGHRPAPAFVDHTPSEMLRAHDIRHVRGGRPV